MPSTVSQIKALQNMGILADQIRTDQCIPFRRYNLIYGMNGSGKSTLSRLFSSLQAGKLSEELPTGGTFSIQMDDGSVLSAPDKLNGLEDRILVFNEDFITNNLQWSEGKAKPVFYIGTDQTSAATELEKITKQLPGLKMRYETADAQLSSGQKALAKYKREKAKIVASNLHLGNRKYEAPQLTKDFEAWVKKTSVVELSDDQLQAAVELRKRAEPPPTIGRIDIDLNDLIELTRETLELLTMSAGTAALVETQKYPQMSLWLKEGTDFHKKERLNECLFCGNKLQEDRLSVLGKALDSALNNAIERVDLARARNSTWKANLSDLKSILPEAGSFSTTHQASILEIEGQLLKQANSLERHLNAFERSILEKTKTPGSAIAISHLPSLETMSSETSSLRYTVHELNELIDRHNTDVTEFAQQKDRAETSIRQHFIAQFRDEMSKLAGDLQKRTSRLEAARNELSDATETAEALRAQIRTHGPAADAINKIIASYLGHQELSLKALDEGYSLCRHGKPIQNSPSEGERTAIAVSYFLSTIDSEDRRLSDLIVLVDDPISSLDTRALNFACSLIKSRLSDASQLFVLTHNQQCLNEFRKAWKSKVRPMGDKEPTASMFYVDVSVPEKSDVRRSKLIELPKLLREYDSEYHFLFSRVLAFNNADADYFEYGYTMPNVLRRVLDIFLGFRCPGNSGLASKLDHVCKQFKDLDRDRLNALDRLSQVESHSDNMDDLIEFSSMTIEETKTASQTLEYLMHEMDPEHTKLITRLCS